MPIPPTPVLLKAVERDNALRTRCLKLATSSQDMAKPERFVLKALAFGLSSREIQFHYGHRREREKFPRRPAAPFKGHAVPDNPHVYRDVYSEHINRALVRVTDNITERNQLRDNWPVHIPVVLTPQEKAAAESKRKQRQYLRKKAWNSVNGRKKLVKEA